MQIEPPVRERTTPRLRLVMGGKHDRQPERTPLERRAFADLAFNTRCSRSEPLGCCESCFATWLRGRLVEHWRGEQFWQELDRGDFGVLRRPFHPNRALLADVVALLATGSENLIVIAWALETGQPLDEVVTILTVLDVNARRLPRFEWLVPTNRCAQR